LLNIFKYRKYSLALLFLFVFASGCNYTTYKSIVHESVEGENDPEPNYDATLNEEYQDFVTYFYMGNRSEMFGTFFNKFYMANEDYDAALEDYRSSTITAYNRRLDSLNITPPVSQTAKDLLFKVIERCSKIIQYNKSTRFLDDAVLLIGKSYYYEGEYLQAERKFNEFLSKLTKSELYDEAILYLGKTKLKMGNNADAETIFLNLFKTTKDNEIKSEITQDLAVLSIMKNDYPGAINNFISSIELTKDKEKKAEKQYILAKIYSVYKPEEADKQYRKAFDITSDFDLLFFSKLNEAKSLNSIGNTAESYKILDKLNGKYRDYPEMKQLVELELANTLYLEKKYSDARTKYFDVIINYAGSKSAADAYYHLAEYSEKIRNNYLNAYINYKKVTETNSASDYSNISAKKTTALDKYFALLAVIKDTTKIVYPENESDFIHYKKIKEKEKGVEEHGKENPRGNENPNPKGGGYRSALMLDSLDITDSNKVVIKSDTNKVEIKPDSNVVLKKEMTDTTGKKISTDTLSKTNLTDTTGQNMVEVKKLSPEDSLLLVIHIEDSIKTSKVLLKIDSYFQMAELFLYELNRTDSALYYLNLIVEDSINPDRTAKALYTIATIYKNRNDDETANEIYRKIILRYPVSSFSNESRRVLGLQLMSIILDSAEVIYRSAENKILKEEYTAALIDLHNVINNYPRDSFYVKSLYSVGWIYENAFKNKDSSIAYYKKLKADFPNSIYASAVIPKLDFYNLWDKRDTTNKSLDSTGVLPDSLKAISDSLNALQDSTKIKKDLLEKEKNKAPRGKDKNAGDISPIENPKERK